MDAVEFLLEKSRICETFKPADCFGCPFAEEDPCLIKPICIYGEYEPEDCVKMVEDWSIAHRQMTNADMFTKVFGHDPVSIRFADLEWYGNWRNKPYKEPKK